MKAAREHLALPNRAGSVSAVFPALPHFPFFWHYHTQCELTLIVRGRGTRWVGDSVADYENGDLVLLGPDLPHSWHSDSATAPLTGEKAVVIHFATDLVAGLPAHLPEFEAVRALIKASRRGVWFPSPPAQIREAMEAVAARTGIDSALRLIDLLDRLSRLGQVNLSSDSYQPELDEETERRLGAVLAHIQRNLGSKLKVADVARLAGLTPSAFSRFFKRNVGTSYVSYVVGQRLVKATAMLIHEELTIAEVAYRCGFNNLSNFNRQFQSAKQMTPGQFRRKYGMVQRI